MIKTSDNTLSLDSFSIEARSLVGQAQKFADDNKCRSFDPAHLLAVLLDIADVAQVLKTLGVNTVALNNQLHGYLNAVAKGEDTSSLARTTIDMLNRAKNNVDKRPVTAFDLLLSLSQEKSGITAVVFKNFDITSEKLNGCMLADKGKNRDLESPYLTNLSMLAQQEKIDAIIGRDNEVRRLTQILGRRSKNHPLLVGEPGVGKRTIVLSLVDRILSNSVPKSFKETTVVQLNTASLLSGAKIRADVENRMRLALNSLQGYNAVLYVRSLESLLVPGLNLNLNDLFGMMFAVPNLRVITSVSPDGLKKVLEKEGNLVKEFTILNVEPTSAECAVEVLRGVASRYERHHKIKIGEEAINLAVKLAKRYVHDRFLPESAIDLIDESASNAMMQHTGVPIVLDKALSRLASIKAQLTGLAGDEDISSNKARALLHTEECSLRQIVSSMSDSMPQLESEVENEALLTEEHIAMVLGEWTNIPATKLLNSDAHKMEQMETILSSKVIDQTEAVSAICRAIKRSRSGLRNLKKPIGSFLFFGSSGVGKTLLAKAVAEFLFDDENAMTRLDMSEFQESHTISKILGSPPGYSGSESGGMLTEAVKKKPYQVVLLDEIEKSSPDIINCLLQTLDDGRLTDSKGTVVDFSNTIIILTSNVGSQKILNMDPLMFDTQEGAKIVRDKISADVNAFFRPEFLNRCDAQIIFRPLTKKSLHSILDIEVRKLEKVLSDRDIKIVLSEDAKKLLVELGYNPAFGARPLNRAIMSYVSDPLSEMLLKAKCPNGSTIKISVDSKNNFILE